MQDKEKQDAHDRQSRQDEQDNKNNAIALHAIFIYYKII